MLATGQFDPSGEDPLGGTIVVRKVDSPEDIFKTFSNCGVVPLSLSFSHDSNLLAAGLIDGQTGAGAVQVLSMTSGNVVDETKSSEGMVISVCFSLPPAQCKEGHALEFMGIDTEGRWGCDGRHHDDGCAKKSEGTGTSKWKRFRCTKCDYDLCDKCNIRSRKMLVDTLGERLLIADEAGNVLIRKCVDSEKFIQVVKFQQKTGDGGASALFSPDGLLIAVISSNMVQFCDPNTGAVKSKIEYPDEVSDVSFSCFDGLRVADDKNQDKKSVQKVSLSLPDTSATEVNLMDKRGTLPCEKYVVVAQGNHVNINKIFAGAKVQDLICTGAVESLSWHPDQTKIVSGDKNGTVAVWDVISGKQLYKFQQGNSRCGAVAFSPCGNLIAAGDDRGKIIIRKAQKTEVIVKSFRNKKKVQCICFSPDGRLIASGDFSKWVMLREVESGAVLSTFMHEDYIYSLAFSPDGELLAAGDDNNALVVHSNPIFFPPKVVMPSWTGLFRIFPHLLLLPPNLNNSNNSVDSKLKEVTCPRDHTCKQTTSGPGWNCACCRNKIDAGIKILWCEKCGWIICNKCKDKLLVEGARHCPKRHLLKAKKTKRKGYNCDVCMESLQKDALMLHCEPCYWLICSGCNAQQGFKINETIDRSRTKEGVEKCEIILTVTCVTDMNNVASGRTLHRMEENQLSEIINDIEGTCGNIFTPVIGENMSAPKLCLEAENKQYNKCKMMLRLIDPSREVTGTQSRETIRKQNICGCFCFCRKQSRPQEYDGDTLAKFMAYLSETSNDSILVDILGRCIIETPSDIDSKNMRISSEDFKAYRLLRTEKCIFSVKDYADPETPPVEIEAICLGPPHFIRRAFKSIATQGSADVLNTQVVDYTIEYLWRQTKHLFYFQFGLFVTFVLSFSAGHYFRLFYLEDSSALWSRSTSYSFFGLAVIISIYFLVLELRQMFPDCICRTKKHVWWGRCGSIRDYLGSGWNRLEIVAYMSCPISVVLAILDDESSDEESMYDNITGAISVLFSWMAMLSHLRGFIGVHAIINTFMQILLDIRSFVGVVVVLWLGGTMAFKVLLPGQPDFLNANALATVFLMVMGDPMMDSLEVESNKTVHGVVTPTHAMVTSVVAKGLSLSFVFIVVIVMMNQLIALMGDSYDNCLENISVENKKARSEVILELIELYRCFLDPDKIYPKWLHVLRPKIGGTKNKVGQWEGKIKVLKSSISESTELLGKQLNVRTAEVNTQFDEIKDEVRSNHLDVELKIATIEQQVTAVDEKVDKALKLLQQLVNLKQTQ
jgi:WD40 repeat protein